MKIYLREVGADDADKIIAWRNSPSIVDKYIDRTPITRESHRRFVENKIKTGLYKQFMVQKLEEDFGVISYSIACVYLKDIDRVNKKCELCMLPSPDYEWVDGAKKQAIQLLLQKAFTEFDINKVYATAFSDSADEIQLLEESGFAKECVMEQEICIDEKFYDLVRYKYLYEWFR